MGTNFRYPALTVGAMSWGDDDIRPSLDNSERAVRLWRPLAYCLRGYCSVLEAWLTMFASNTTDSGMSPTGVSLNLLMTE
jgi:hypothetical protein